MAVLPPGLTAGQFLNALSRFRQVGGEEWVIESDEHPFAYQDFLVTCATSGRQTDSICSSGARRSQITISLPMPVFEPSA